MQARLGVLTELSHVRKMAVGSEAPTIIQPPLYKARRTMLWKDTLRLYLLNGPPSSEVQTTRKMPL